MKSNLYWIKVGLLIGLGIFLAYWLFPFALVLGAVLVPAFLLVVLIVMLAAALARPLNILRRDLKLRQGWVERARR